VLETTLVSASEMMMPLRQQRLAFADLEPVTVRTTSNSLSLTSESLYSKISPKVRFRENGGRVTTVAAVFP
jgi:hypothetical protein